MIQYNSKNAYLEIPKGLGNLGGNSGGGTDVSALSGSVVELQSTVESEAARLNGLSAITENIASQATSAAAGVNTLSGAVETLSSQVDSQGDAIADLLLDSDALDTRVSGNTADIAALSGRVDTLSSSTVNGLETAQNTANSANTLASSAYTRADAAYNLAESLTGGSDGNYLIVNSLSEISDPVKGMLAYAKYTVINKAWIIDASQISENYVAHIYYDGENNTTVYRSGSDFFWDWKNYASDWTYGNNIWYKIDKDNGLFYAACDSPAAYITLENGATSAETTAQITIDSPYLYNGTEWEKKSLVTDYFLENMTRAERLSLYNMLADIMGGHNDGEGITKVFSNYRFFTSAGQIDGQTTSQVFFSNFENGGVYFCGTKTSKISYEVEIYRVVAFINGSDGSLQTNVGAKEIPRVTQNNINLDSTGAYTNTDELGALSSEQGFNIWFRWTGTNGTDWGMVPAKYIWRRIESINGEDKLVYYWAIENLFINGTAYKGSWHSVEFDWGNYTTDSWTAQ